MSVPIILHLTAVIPALFLGLVVLLSKKGTAIHKLLGRVWVVLMLVTSISSFFISSNGTYSIIHILSVVSIASISISIWAILNRNIRTHRGFMIGAYIGAVIAGFFATFIPGRVVYTFLFGPG